jgi:eukaryotic-like serine/threonine-protein kinase
VSLLPTKAPAAAPATETLVAGQFRVDIAQPLPGAGGGLSAFAVTDRRDGQAGLMAVQVRRHLPARPQALQHLTGEIIEGLLTPLAYGPAPAPGGEEAGFVICQAPPGPALSAALRPWSEPELLNLVLRPAARVLDQLAQRGLTHRGIRAENVFRIGPGHPVVLGCAWATPPAALQPAVAEPPYVSVCPPGSRGDGNIADDVYALGVLMLTLALGQSPLAGVPEAEVTLRKLDHGSHAVLLGEHRLGSFVADLLRGMLAEDPEHRPPPMLLLDASAARSRRIAARPPQRAPQPIKVGDLVCWHSRTLAHALATQPELGLQALKTGAVGQWLRRGLGDGALAVRLDEQLGLRAGGADGEASDADAMSLLRVVTVLDPLAPMCWNGMILWPDAIGTALAAALQDPPVPTNIDQAGRIAKLIAMEAQVAWAALHPAKSDTQMLRTDARRLSAPLHLPGAAGSLTRLTYQLNPLLPCIAAGLAGRWVVQLHDLLPALEAAARRDRAQALPLAGVVAAFIAARGDRAVENLVVRLDDTAGGNDPLAQLRLLAALQSRYHVRPLPALGAWVAERIDALLVVWQSRPRRIAVRANLHELASTGQLTALLTLLDDSQAHRNDEREVQQAVRDLGRLDAALAGLANGGSVRADRARRIGQEVAAGIGLSALAMLLMIAALG